MSLAADNFRYRAFERLVLPYTTRHDSITYVTPACLPCKCDHHRMHLCGTNNVMYTQKVSQSWSQKRLFLINKLKGGNVACLLE